MVRPFASWLNEECGLSWYQAYNDTKHARNEQFELATFRQMLDAICGLVAILSAQFIDEDYSPGPDIRVVEGNNDGFELAIGGFFLSSSRMIGRMRTGMILTGKRSKTKMIRLSRSTTIRK